VIRIRHRIIYSLLPWLLRRARVAISKDVVYTGSENEDYRTRLRRVNDEAAAEGWNLDDKRRAAALTLQGAAKVWNTELGHQIVGWDAWEAALRLSFVSQLSDVEWAF
jgi:hypothetical protein